MRFMLARWTNSELLALFSYTPLVLLVFYSLENYCKLDRKEKGEPGDYLRYDANFKSVFPQNLTTINNTTVEPRLSGLAIFSKNGHVNSCYHDNRNVYLLRMRPHALLFTN